MKSFEYSRKCHYGTVCFLYDFLQVITQIRICKQWKFQSVLAVFTGIKKKEENKNATFTRVKSYTIRFLWRFYDASMTKRPITIINCTQGTCYLCCKELYKKISYIAPDINKKDFLLKDVTLTIDSVTMRQLNLTKM